MSERTLRRSRNVLAWLFAALGVVLVTQSNLTPGAFAVTTALCGAFLFGCVMAHLLLARRRAGNVMLSPTTRSFWLAVVGVFLMVAGIVTLRQSWGLTHRAIDAVAYALVATLVFWPLFRRAHKANNSHTPKRSSSARYDTADELTHNVPLRSASNTDGESRHLDTH